jgi:hypothetical protein
VHSFGVLGVIGAPAEQAADILANAAKLEAGLQVYVARSVVVLSTGGEVARGEIEDTNYAAVKSILGDQGYLVDHAGVTDPVLLDGRGVPRAVLRDRNAIGAAVLLHVDLRLLRCVIAITIVPALRFCSACAKGCDQREGHKSEAGVHHGWLLESKTTK